MDDEHLKDFYAGLAMMGLIHHFDFARFSNDPMRVAMWSFDAAEAMMQEREVRRGQGDARDRASL